MIKIFDQLKVWLWLFLPPAAALLTVELIKRQVSLSVSLFIGLVVAICLLHQRIRRPALFICVTFFFAVLGAGVLERQLTTQVWYSAKAFNLKSLLGDFDRDLVEGRGRRVWKVPEATSGLRLTFEAKINQGSWELDWFRSDARFQLLNKQEGQRNYVEVSTPQGFDPYLMQSYKLDQSIAGRVFRVEVEMRSKEQLLTEGCRGIWLQVWGEGGGFGCTPVQLDNVWKRFDYEWQAPETVQSSVIRVVLNNLDGLTYDLGESHLYLQQEGSWLELSPLYPQAIYIGYQGMEKGTELLFRPSSTWNSFAMDIPISWVNDKRELVLYTQLGSGSNAGLRVNFRNLKLFDQNSETMKPIPSLSRQSFLFAHPNFAAHTLVSLAMLLVLIVNSSFATLSVGILTLGAVFLTGTRTAWFAAYIGFLLFLWFQKKRFVVIVAVIVSVVAVLVFFGDVRILSTVNKTSRVDIWKVAWLGFTQNMWLGSPNEFATFWQANYTGNSDEVVGHAHNFWLQFAFDRGFIGLLSSFWLSIGFLYLAWSAGRWQGLIPILVILGMNVFDYTLLYSGVFLPCILILQVLNVKQVERLAPKAR